MLKIPLMLSWKNILMQGNTLAGGKMVWEHHCTNDSGILKIWETVPTKKMQLVGLLMSCADVLQRANEKQVLNGYVCKFTQTPLHSVVEEQTRLS